MPPASSQEQGAAAEARSSRTIVAGTAGHVDHGKSTLVKALTGTDPDRLNEERERAMTIDLGFAWLPLSNGTSVSIVDVPGHERFIKNMLAGVGGIDVAILVIAADEGPMPQTTEHLAILDLLDVQHGIVVLTKRDLVDDDWLELVREETRERLIGTSLADAAIIAVDSLSRSGLDELVAEIERLADEVPGQVTGGRPRLPVDRSFTVAGFGTVVTGTLTGSVLEIGQEVEIVPSGRRSRIRGLQSHGKKSDRALPGSRTAVNLTGIERDDIHRGDVLTTPGWLQPTTMLDARLRVVADAPEPLEQNEPIDIFIGAAESPAHLTLLDNERLAPGAEGWVQIRLDQPIAAVAGDHFIIRRASPSQTLGGGRVIDPHPRRHRRFRTEVLHDLETRATGTPEERFVQALAEGPLELRAIAERLSIDVETARGMIGSIRDLVVPLGEGDNSALPPNRYLAQAVFVDAQRGIVMGLLKEYHRRAPLRRGMPREDIKSRLNAKGRAADALLATLAADGSVSDLGSLLALPEHEISLTADQQRQVDAYRAALTAEPISPPAPDAFGISPDLLAAMVELGYAVRVADGVVYGTGELTAIEARVKEILDTNGSITLAEFRDVFGTSRKYAQAVLEYLDRQRITRRVGDARVRGSG
ncbi:MAG: selenocysteine-specific translation elongation factor [Thermomicrobiales bacterium]|nr:selenocysteine-specific translation elongation factor [Thermomicrobiales bacterium]